MIAAGDTSLTWDPNGRLATKDDYQFIYNGDGKLREVLDVNDSPLIKLKYDPMGYYDSMNLYHTSADGKHRLPFAILAKNTNRPLNYAREDSNS